MSEKTKENGTEKEQKHSKELKDMMNAISKWVKKHEGNVSFVGNFFADTGEPDFEFVEGRMMAYGPKPVLETHMETLKEEIDKEEKDEFVNW